MSERAGASGPLLPGSTPLRSTAGETATAWGIRPLCLAVWAMRPNSVSGEVSPETEFGRIAQTAKQSGLMPHAVAVSPAVDLKGVLPGSKGPDAPALSDIYRAARAAFPGVKIGGGM